MVRLRESDKEWWSTQNGIPVGSHRYPKLEQSRGGQGLPEPARAVCHRPLPDRREGQCCHTQPGRAGVSRINISVLFFRPPLPFIVWIQAKEDRRIKVCGPRRSGPPRPGGSSRWIWRDSQTPRVPSSASLSASLEITSRIQLSHSSSLIPSWSQPLFLTWATELASIHFPSFSFFIYLLFKGFFLWCRPFFKKTIEFVTALLIVLCCFFFWPQFMWDFDSLSRDWTHILCIGRRNLSRWTTRKVPAPALFFYSMYDP